MRLFVELVGKSPLLFNRMSDEAAEQATSGTRGASAAQERLSPEDDARARLHVDDAGTVIMPALNLMACFKWGGRFHKVGANKVSTRDHSMIPGAVTFNEPHYKLLSDGGWHVFANNVTIPATGGKIIRYRPCFYDWAIEFECDLETSIISEQLFRNCIDTAANMSGLGDFRPSKGGGPFGKFRVDTWERLTDDKPANAPKPVRRKNVE